jgi:hypothetical protein
MMPAGHLATSLVLAGAAYGLGFPLELAAGCFSGGFLIDMDHYLDYLVFERQWRRPGPASFLRYYFKYLPRRLVLPLHSLELMTGLAALAAVWPRPWLAGYLIGAAMHLGFDMLVNGDHVSKRRVLFYSFAYRAVQRFAAGKLLDHVQVASQIGARPYREFFFRWRSPGRRIISANVQAQR